ncbi:hypothetical protein [Leptospira wolffii]|uniref:hypothetical protein n=1 Tax=Leptospira wolffii TaxID=409998 RepID=UPI00058FB2BF|nr:hypothetical protein [Leptospira wolffii]
MEKKDSFDFASFVSANSSHYVSGFDYLQIVYKSNSLHTDFIFWFSKLFWPDFKIIDGKVFLQELFDQKYYDELIGAGENDDDIQFWMNLLELTGLFDDLPLGQAIDVSKSLVQCWNSKLSIDGIVSVRARAIFEEDTEELFITIDDH